MGDQVSSSDVISSVRVPTFCPICGSLMKGSRSTQTYYDFGCCLNCHIEFVEDREQRWKGGWRPDQEQIKSYKKRLSECT